MTLLGNEYRVAGPAFSISLLLSFADTAAPALDELYRRSGDQPETEQQADEEDEEVEVVENATGMAAARSLGRRQRRPAAARRRTRRR